MKEYTNKQTEESDNTDNKKLLTVREFASILRVDDTTVRRWIRNGALPAVILPHLHTREAYRIKQETLDKLLSPAS